MRCFYTPARHPRLASPSAKRFLGLARLALILACTLQKGRLHAEGTPSRAELSDLQLATLTYRGGNDNPRPHGLPRMAWELRKRTSIAASLDVARVDPASVALFNYPLVVWQGDAAFEPLPPAAVANLRHYLYSGGSLLIDVNDGDVPGPSWGPFESAVRRDLQRIVGAGPGNGGLALKRVSPEHVIYKSFYLVDRHGGRVPRRPYLEAVTIDKRLAVVLSGNDLAGAMSRGAFGEWDYDVGPGGATTREMTFRLGINWVMYTLCLNYKEDQVHLPFILKRRS